MDKSIFDKTWYAKPDDLIGGWCVMPVDKIPSEAKKLGIHAIGGFMTEQIARHVADLHNKIAF